MRQTTKRGTRFLAWTLALTLVCQPMYSFTAVSAYAQEVTEATTLTGDDSSVAEVTEVTEEEFMDESVDTITVEEVSADEIPEGGIQNTAETSTDYGTRIAGGFCGATGHEEDLTWAVYDGADEDAYGETLVISGTGAMADYKPWMDDNFNNIITAPWFSYRSSLKKLVLSEGITHIGNYAFTLETTAETRYFFSGELVLPDSLRTIGEYAFKGASGFYGTLVLPDGLTGIGNSAFYECTGFAGSLTLPDSVTDVGSSAFRGCRGFQSLQLSSSMNRISDFCFLGCSSLSGNLVIPEGVQTIENGAFRECTGFTGNLVIPEGVASVDYTAFFGCRGFNGTLTLPESLRTVGEQVFRNCTGLSGDLVVPEGVTDIGERAFQGANGFGSLYIPASVKTIGMSALNLAGTHRLYCLSAVRVSENSIIGSDTTRVENYTITRRVGDTLEETPTGAVYGDGRAHVYTLTSANVAPPASLPANRDFTCWTYNGNVVREGSRISVSQNVELVASLESFVARGECGATVSDNLIWTVYDSDDEDTLGDTLVISGNGAMAGSPTR